jgi:hypothetical protein
MKGFMIIVATTAMLSACGSATGDRVASGAGIGAGVGLIAGPPGALVGGLAGAAIGGETNSSQINLGKPVWDTKPAMKPWWATEP